MTGLEAALANKQPILGPTASVQLASLTCSLIKATAAEQSLRLSDPNGLVLLTLDNAAATFLRSISAPSLDVSGTLLCSQSSVIGGPLYVGGTNIVDAIADAGGTTIKANTQLHVASLKAGNATPSEAGASAFVDLDAQNLLVNRVRAPAKYRACPGGR